METKTISGWIRTHVFGLSALFLALTVAPAWGAATVGSSDIKPDAVLSKHIKNGHVRSPDISSGAVQRSDIANAAVNNLKLATGAVGPAKLANGAVNSGKVADNSLTGADIAEGTLTGVTPSGTAAGDLTGAYPSPLIASGAVNSAKVADGSLTGVDIDEATLGLVPNADALDGISSGGFWQVGGNAGLTSANFLGTSDDTPLNLGVGNAAGLRIEPASDGTNPSPNVVGGSPDNRVESGAFAATIAGGGRSNPAGAGTANEVDDDYGTVGGGADNRAGNGTGTTSDADFATVGGGVGNRAPGSHSTVAGGISNTASGSSAAVGGGSLNSASGIFATVAGGGGNIASGTDATVPGGSGNSAQGGTSLAAGKGAQANNDGAFVWGDSQSGSIASTANNQFIARAAGHFFLQSDSSLDDQGGFLNTSTGAFLSTGGTWTNSSDENLKRGFAAVGPRRVLDKVAALPVRSWEYKAEPGVRHLGPTAQDFYAAFGLGEDNRHIASVDADGVSLAAIKGLAAQNAKLRSVVSHLQVRVARIERGQR